MLEQLANRFGGAGWVMALVVSAVCLSAGCGWGQERTAREQHPAQDRHTGGMRVGEWRVREPSAANTVFQQSATFEVFIQRGLDEHIALENSLGVWRRRATVPGTLNGDVVTRSYLAPLITSLKLFPLTTASNPLEPYLSFGVGFALGIEDKSKNAIGGGGTSTATGFGFKAGAGLELHPTRVLGLAAHGRYMWLKFGEKVGGQDLYKASGVEAALVYRFSH